jgi:RHS repeat-associated protein
MRLARPSVLRPPSFPRHSIPFLTLFAASLATLLALCASPARAQEALEYYGTDAVGSVRVVFAPDGTVKARSDYLPFGEESGVTTPVGPLPSQRFTGQQRDAEEGHDNFNARTYQTRLGRLTSVDPVFAGLVEPQRWNRYTYALNNPLAYADPDGRDPIRMTDPNVTYVMGCGGGCGPVDTIDQYFWTYANWNAYSDPFASNVDAALGWEDIFNSGTGIDTGTESGTGTGTEGPDTGFVERKPLPPPSENAVKVAAAVGAVVIGTNAVVAAAKWVSPFFIGAAAPAVPKAADVSYRLTQTVANHTTDIVTRGQFAGQLARPYLNSQLTIREIMSAGRGLPDPGGVAGALRWDVAGTFRGSQGTWELVVQRDLILHFNFVR